MTRVVSGTLLVLLSVCLAPAPLDAQTFDVAGREVQLHGFVSGAFGWTSDNNFLTMTTSDGSVFGEAGANASVGLTSKLRVGAQVYVRRFGELGKGQVYLDWAFADYRVKDWLGFRAGKVKTTLGLHTDTQDQAFLHTWALLPQSIYPADLRSVAVAHSGADMYGHIEMKRAGVLSYTAFAGTLPDDESGGYRYGLAAQGARVSGAIAGRVQGYDLRWDTPVVGLTVGGSMAFIQGDFRGTLGVSPVPLTFSSSENRLGALFAEYARGGLHVEAEYTSHRRRADVTAEIPGRPVVRRPGSDEPAWYLAGAYRFSKRIEAGTYYSHYKVRLINPVVPVAGPGRDHEYDKVVTLRLDLASFWDVKIEGHFMDGVGSPAQAHGFYPQDNPRGFAVKTNMLILRTGWYF